MVLALSGIVQGQSFSFPKSLSMETKPSLKKMNIDVERQKRRTYQHCHTVFEALVNASTKFGDVAR